MERWALAPTATWPNETLEGLAAKASLVAPAASSSSLSTEFEALLLKIADVPTHPVVVGEKVTFTATLLPAGITRGNVRPDMLNSFPLSLIAETVTLFDPVLDKTTTCVSLCPTRTPPKRTTDGAHVSCSAARAGNGNIMTMAAKVRRKTTRIDA